MKNKTIYYNQNGKIDYATTFINAHPLFCFSILIGLYCLCCIITGEI